MIDDKLFESIARNMDVGVCVYDANGRFIYVNPKMIQWRKVSYQQYLSMNVHDFFDDTSDPCVFDLVMRNRKTISHLQYYQDWMPQKPSPKRLRIVTGVPIFDPSGSICNVITYLQDIEDYNRKLMQLNAQHEDIFLVRAPQDTGVMAAPNTDDIISQSSAMKSLLNYAHNAARTDAAILLYGESGTGKEVLANYIYQNSLRSNRPFIEVNCAAFSENLLESDLFGYEKGSFTGALSTGKKGLVETADGGTLFLDEINSLPLSLQGKLLRLIEEKTFRRIGSNTISHTDFRLISATNVDLKKMTEEGTFRADLYYRLNVIPLQIPPLRERKDDIIPLCQFFSKKISEQYGMQKAFSQEALNQIYACDWPGNIRELKNFIERVFIMTARNSDVINSVPTELLEQQPGVLAQPPVQSGNRKQLTRELINSALTLCNGRRDKAAQYLGISKRTLQYKIREFDLPHKSQ